MNRENVAESLYMSYANGELTDQSAMSALAKKSTKISKFQKRGNPSAKLTPHSYLVLLSSGTSFINSKTINSPV